MFVRPLKPDLELYLSEVIDLSVGDQGEGKQFSDVANILPGIELEFIELGRRTVVTVYIANTIGAKVPLCWVFTVISAVYESSFK